MVCSVDVRAILHICCKHTHKVFNIVCIHASEMNITIYTH
jgi:hypothetical protein